MQRLVRAKPVNPVLNSARSRELTRIHHCGNGVTSANHECYDFADVELEFNSSHLSRPFKMRRRPPLYLATVAYAGLHWAPPPFWLVPAVGAGVSSASNIPLIFLALQLPVALNSSLPCLR